MMAGRGYPSRDGPEQSNYPSPPGDDEERRSQYPLPPLTTTNMAMHPSAPGPAQAPAPPNGYPHDQRYPDQRFAAGQRYPHDPRGDPRGAWTDARAQPNNGYGSPNPPPSGSYPPMSATHPPGYAPPNPNPPAGGFAPPSSQYPLPPVQAAQDQRPYDDRRPYDERAQYPDRGMPSDPYYQQGLPHQGRGGYGADVYPYRYPPAPNYNPYGPGAPTAPPQQPQQAAPRQRTSIACKYCRKRKIRCSGYQNTTNGKCSNCDKLRIDCIFQPVSSNPSTAFVPVAAVAGGVPPGTPLYGAYGQPLPSSTQPQPQPPPPRGYPHSASEYPPPPQVQSPSLQYPPFDDSSRRRPRPQDEEHAIRLPPPNNSRDDDPRRRSPASNHSNVTPPTYHQQYPQGGYGLGQEPNRTPTPHRNSPGNPAPTIPSQPSARSNPMSLDRFLENDPNRDAKKIDTDMLNKLNGRRG